jgi:hypothetical protein
MQTSRLSHLIARMQRLRQMIDKARRQSSSPFDVLRIQALLLKAQQQLAEALLPVPAPAPIPVRVRSRHH